MCCSVLLLLVNEMQMSCFSATPHLRLTMDNEQGIAHFQTPSELRNPPLLYSHRPISHLVQITLKKADAPAESGF